MKKILLGIVFIFDINCLFGQLAIINDKEEYVDLHSDKSINSAIVGRVLAGDFFEVWAEKENDEWWHVYYYVSFDSIMYSKKKYTNDVEHVANLGEVAYMSGFIHKSNVVVIDSLKCIPPEYFSITPDSLSMKNDSIDLKIQIANFDTSKHKISRGHDGFIGMIDKRKQWVFPTSRLPKTEISKISLSINKCVVDFPDYLYNDSFEPNLCCIDLFYDTKGNLYLYLTYEYEQSGIAAWLISKGRIISRYKKYF